MTIRQPRFDEVECLWRAASASIALPLARPGVIARVLEGDPETIWVFERAGLLGGGIAFLHLNTRGAGQLRRGDLDPGDPAPDLLARPDEPPAACYFWMAFKRHPATPGVQNALSVLRRPRFRRAELWARPYTDDGRRALARIGLGPAGELGCPGLYRSPRAAHRLDHRDR